MVLMVVMNIQQMINISKMKGHINDTSFINGMIYREELKKKNEWHNTGQAHPGNNRTENESSING